MKLVYWCCIFLFVTFIYTCMHMNIIIHLLRIGTLTSASFLLMFEDIAQGNKLIRKSADFLLLASFPAMFFCFFLLTW